MKSVVVGGVHHGRVGRHLSRATRRLRRSRPGLSAPARPYAVRRRVALSGGLLRRVDSCSFLLSASDLGASALPAGAGWSATPLTPAAAHSARTTLAAARVSWSIVADANDSGDIVAIVASTGPESGQLSQSR